MAYPASPAASVVLLLTVSASNSVRATPANLGVAQLVYASTAQMMGLPGQEAVGVALLLQAVQTVPVMVAALALLPTRARPLPA